MIDSEYDLLVKKVSEYIVSERKKNKNLTIVELLCEYVFKNDIEVEKLGDAISENDELKTLIAHEVKIVSNKNIVDEW